jgi:hypothetical protein
MILASTETVCTICRQTYVVYMRMPKVIGQINIPLWNPCCSDDCRLALFRRYEEGT